MGRRLRGGPAPHVTELALQEPAAGVLPISSLGGAHVEPLSLDGLDEERLDRLRQTGIKVRQPKIGELVREAAARAQASTPLTSVAADIEGFRAVVRLMVDAYYRTGQVDPRRALRRSSVDRYLVEKGLETRRTVRWQLYAAGKAQYPREYPERRVVEAPRQQATPPMPARQIAALYTIATVIGPKEAGALMRLLDFVGGVGAKPADMHHLRRCDIRTETIDRRTWTLVTLQSSSTRPRAVPVWDESVATRIRSYAKNARHDLIMALGSKSHVERNALNRVNSRLAEAGYAERLDVKALRNAWLARMAEVLPAGPFLQIAGLGTLPRLIDMGLDRDAPGDLSAVVSVLAAAEDRGAL